MPMPKILPHARGGYYMNATFGGKRVSIYGRTPEDVEQKYIKKSYEYGLGIKIGQRVLMKDYMRAWLALRKDELKPYTYDGYRNNVENHIIPALGEKYVHQLLPADIRAFYNSKRKERETAPAEHEKLLVVEQLQATATTEAEKAAAADALAKVDQRLAKCRPLSETSLLYVHRILHAALNDAVENQIITFSPMRGVKAPKRNPVNRKLPAEDGIRRLFDSVKGEEYELGVHLAVTCGLRRGEICAAEWGSIDWDRSIITVDKAIVQTKDTGRVVDLPKEEKIREVAIPETLLFILKAEQERQGTDVEFFGRGYRINNYIVKHRDGTPYTPTALSSAINDAIRRANITTTLHGLRSTFVSIGYKLGGDEKAITDSAGHHSVEFNRSRYQSVYDSMKVDLAGKMDKALYEKDDTDE